MALRDKIALASVQTLAGAGLPKATLLFVSATIGADGAVESYTASDGVAITKSDTYEYTITFPSAPLVLPQAPVIVSSSLRLTRMTSCSDDYLVFDTYVETEGSLGNSLPAEGDVIFATILAFSH